MRLKLKSLCLGILVLLAGLAAHYSGASESPAIKQLVYRIELPGNSRFYGSAILFRSERDKVYFLTNSHVVDSRDGTLVPRLRVAGDALGKKSHGFTLEGSAPGFDLAVISVARSEFSSSSLKQAERILPAAFLDQELPNGPCKECGLLGLENRREDSELDRRTLSWGQERLLGSGLTSRDEGWLRSLSGVTQDSSDAKLVWITPICNLPFLNRCYMVTIRSWGFSGGAFFVRSSQSSIGHVIAGIPYQFSFLSAETYVIPIGKALQVAQDIINRSPLAQIDLTGRVTAIDLTTLKIIKGPLAGQTVREASGGTVRAGGDVAYGGSDPVHGGGDPIHGGGDPIHGGGDPVHGGSDPVHGGSDPVHGGGSGSAEARFSGIERDFMSYLRRNVSLYSKGLKGVDSVFRFRQGVVLGDRLIQSALIKGKVYPILDLNDFVTAYAAEPNAQWLGNFDPLRVPDRLEGSQRKLFGMTGFRTGSGNIMRISNASFELRGNTLALVDIFSALREGKEHLLGFGRILTFDRLEWRSQSWSSAQAEGDFDLRIFATDEVAGGHSPPIVTQISKQARAGRARLYLTPAAGENRYHLRILIRYNESRDSAWEIYSAPVEIR